MLRTPPDFQPGRLATTPHDADLSFCFRRDELLLRDSDLDLPRRRDLRDLGMMASESLLPLGQWNGQSLCCGAIADLDLAAPVGFHWRKLRSTFGVLDDAVAALAGRAFQLAEWSRTHVHCGACGTRTERLEHEYCARCPQCGHAAYPRISPAMMVLVRHGGRLLLARHAGRPGGFFTALAGFLEAGESIEEAIHREVHEEVGLKVRDLRYVASQSWPFPHSLMIAFTAEYESGDLRPDPNEIAEAQWFGPDDPAPIIPPPVSVASYLIRRHAPPQWGLPTV